MPLQADPQSTDQAHVLLVCARLPHGLGLAQANAQMAVVGKQYVQAASNPLVGDDGQIQVAPRKNT